MAATWRDDEQETKIAQACAAGHRVLAEPSTAQHVGDGKSRRDVRHGRVMRVAVVTESFLPTINGVTSSVVQAVTHLQRRGHDTLVLAPRPQRRLVAGAGDGVVRVPSVALPGYPGFRIGLPSQAGASALRRFRPDVIHLASPVALGAWATTCARDLQVPTVAVYQTDLPGYTRRYRLAWAERAVWRWLRAIHGRAALTLAPSAQTLFALRSHGFPRLALWGRGVDLDRFSPAHRSQRLREWLAPSGEVIVGYVGRLAPEKQCEDLVALRDVPGIRLVVVGDGPSRQQLSRLLPDAVFLGFLRDHDLARAYAALDIFVHTGAHETFGQTLQEAMASGVPVIAPARGGPLDQVEDGVNGALFEPGDLSGLRRAVVRMVEDEAHRSVSAHRARRSVATRSWGALTDQLIGHYRTVVSTLNHQEDVAS